MIADEDIIEVAIFMDACLRLFTFLNKVILRCSHSLGIKNLLSNTAHISSMTCDA